MIDPSVLNELESDPDFIELKRLNPKKADEVVRFAARKAVQGAKTTGTKISGRSPEIKGFLERNLSPVTGEKRKGFLEAEKEQAAKTYGTSFTGRTQAFLTGQPQMQEEPGEASPRLQRLTEALGKGEYRKAAGEVYRGAMRAPSKALEIAKAAPGAIGEAITTELVEQGPDGQYRFAGMPGTAAALGAVRGSVPDILASMALGGGAGLAIKAAAPKVAGKVLGGAARVAGRVSPGTEAALRTAATRAAQPLGPAGTFASLQAGQAVADYYMPYVQTKLAGGTDEQALAAARLGVLTSAPLGLVTGAPQLRQIYDAAVASRVPPPPSRTPSVNLMDEAMRGQPYTPPRPQPQRFFPTRPEMAALPAPRAPIPGEAIPMGPGFAEPGAAAMYGQPGQYTRIDVAPPPVEPPPPPSLGVSPEQLDLIRRFTMGERLPAPQQVLTGAQPPTPPAAGAMVPYQAPGAMIPSGRSPVDPRIALEQQFGTRPGEGIIYGYPPSESMALQPVGPVVPRSTARERAAFEQQFGVRPVDETIYAPPPSGLESTETMAMQPVGPVVPRSTVREMQEAVMRGEPIQLPPGMALPGARALYGQAGVQPPGQPLTNIPIPSGVPPQPAGATGAMSKGARQRVAGAQVPPVVPGAVPPPTTSARAAAAQATAPVPTSAIKKAQDALEKAMRDRDSAEMVLGKQSREYKKEDASVKKAQAELDALKKKEQITPEQPEQSLLQRLITEEKGEFDTDVLARGVAASVRGGLTGVSNLIDSAGRLIDNVRGSAVSSVLRERAQQIPTMGGRAGGVVSGSGRAALDAARRGAQAISATQAADVAGQAAGRAGSTIAGGVLPRVGDVVETVASLPFDVMRRPATFMSDQLAQWAADNPDAAIRGVVKSAANVLGRNSYENAEAFKKMLRTPVAADSAFYNSFVESLRRFAIGRFGMSKSMIDAVQAIEDKAISDLRALQDYGAELIARYGDDQEKLIKIGKDLEDPNYSGRDDLILRGKQILKDISTSVYETGGITQAAFERYGKTGSYLPRIYRKFLVKNENNNGMLLEYFRLANEDPSLSGYEHRGLVERMSRGKMEQDIQKGIMWEELGTDPKDPNKVVAWRDWTEEEQNKWAREWNPMPAIVKLHEQALRDIRAGRIFEYLRNGQDELGVYAKKVYDLGLDPTKEKPKNFIDENGQNWVYLDPSVGARKGVSKYGRLGGMYVRDDIASYLKFHNEYGDFRRIIRNIKRYTGQDYFKQMVTLWSTKYYVNNFFNAMPMVELAGGSVTDMPLALKELRANSELIKLLEKDNVIRRGAMLRQLAKYAEDTLAENLKKDGYIGHKAASLVLGDAAKKIAAARRGLQGISEATDDLWRVTLYMGLRRRKNLSHKEAIDIVRDAIYESKNVTSPLADAAEIAIPFAKSATWMLDQTVTNSIRNPHKLAYLVGIGAFLPWAMGKMSGATEEKMRSEEEIIQDFLKDPKIPGTDKTFAIGIGKKLRLFEDKDGKAYYLDTSNFGGLQGAAADVGDSAFTYLPKALQPGGPYWMLVQLIMNRDQFKDQQIVMRDDMGREITVDRGWLYSPVAEFVARQMAPSVVVDSIRLARSMFGIPEPSGTVVSTGTRLAGMAGFKIREVDREMQAPLREYKGSTALGQWQKEINKQYRILERMNEKGASQEQIIAQEQKIEALENRLEELTMEEEDAIMKIYEGLE